MAGGKRALAAQSPYQAIDQRGGLVRVANKQNERRHVPDCTTPPHRQSTDHLPRDTAVTGVVDKKDVMGSAYPSSALVGMEMAVLILDPAPTPAGIVSTWTAFSASPFVFQGLFFINEGPKCVSLRH